MVIAALADLQVLLQVLAYQQLTAIRAFDRQVVREGPRARGPVEGCVLRWVPFSLLTGSAGRDSSFICTPSAVHSRVIGTGESEEEEPIAL